MARKTLRRLFPVLFLLVVMGSLYWWAESGRQPPEYPKAYVAQSSAILWNSNAQIRQAVATLHYGDHVTILQRSSERSEIRTDAGTQGWIDSLALMDADLWQQAAALLAHAKDMPVQARGHTRTISNVRLAAGRGGARIFQFGRNEPVEVLERATRPVPVESAAETAVPETSLPKLEDWLLVLRTASPPGEGQAADRPASVVSPGRVSAVTTPDIPIAGWVLARFVDLDPPAPIPDYLNGSDIHVVAWFVINMAQDESGAKPQYLVAGAQGGEGQPCDFTLLRFYTWSTRRHRYETAYINNDVCGKMPIRVTSSRAGQEFRFADPMENGAERVYRVRQTTVRQIASSSQK